MKRHLIPLTAVLLTAVSLCTSCMGDDEEDMVFPHSASLTAVKLGTLKRVLHTTTRDGRDSTYTINLTGTYYPLHIDQLGGRVYNTDSLPTGTDVSRVTFSTVSHTGTGIGINALAAEGDTIFTSTDSTDLSLPRTLTVYNAYGEKRAYRLELNCHREEGDSFVWHPRGDAAGALARAERLKAFVDDGEVTLFALENGRTVRLQAPKQTPWTLSRHTADAGAPAPDSIVRLGDTYYGLAGGALVESADGLGWNVVLARCGLKALAGSGTKHLVGLGPEGFRSSADGGRTWTDDRADEPGRLPESDLRCTRVPSKTDPTFEEIIVTGRRGAESVVWRRYIDLEGGETYAWDYLPAPESSADVACPLLESAAMAAYDGSTLLMGLDPATGDVARPRMSRENGRTWRTGDVKPIADAVRPVCLAMTADATDIYVFAGGTGQVWTGRFNRLGWQWSPDDNYVWKKPRR